jgi:type II secretory pathway component PulJ
MQRKAAEMLDRAKQRLSAAAGEARRIRTQAEQDAEEILVEARRDALSVLREAAGGTVQGGEAREELHRITWMLKNLESAVRDALSHLQATDDRFSVVVLDDAADTSEASAMADVHAGEQGAPR